MEPCIPFFTQLDKSDSHIAHVLMTHYPAYFLSFAFRQNTSAVVWSQKSCRIPPLRSHFTCWHLMMRRKHKIPADGTDNRSLCTRGSHVCGWFLHELCVGDADVWCRQAHLQDITQGETVKLTKNNNKKKTRRHCWAHIIQITSSGETFLNLMVVYLISIVLVIVAQDQFHRELRQVRGDSTGSVTDQGERWDVGHSEVSYNPPKRLRCGEKKKTHTHKRNITKTNELHCDVITWTVTTSGPPKWATAQTYKLPQSSSLGRMLQQCWLQGRRRMKICVRSVSVSLICRSVSCEVFEWSFRCLSL